jgi:hypothetical protein
MILLKMEQHPVGQGGLATGEIRSFQGHRLGWTYDCGSNQDDALVREITRAAEPGQRELLFLSHLDSDHVSGVDRFLDQCPTRHVVLPYLDELHLLAVMARDSVRGRLTRLFRDAASNLPGWFAERGVQSLTFVRGAADEGGAGRGEGDPRPPDGAEGGGGEGETVAEWTLKPTLSPSTGAPGGGGGAIVVQEVSADAALRFRRAGAVLDWTLVPHVHEPGPDRLERFRDLLRGKFGEPLDLPTIIKAAQNQDARKKLRDCYDGLWSDHNLVSMALYSGPARSSGKFTAYCQWRRRFGHHLTRPGVLLTGDAHLDQRERRRALFDHYRHFVDHVGALMLPHHGSIHNFHEELLEGFPNLELAFACSGPNNYGHPHLEVRLAVERARLHYRRVSHKRSRAIAWQVDFRG